MNFATAALALILAALFALAIRYQVKNGPCAACEMKSSCKKKPGARPAPSGGAGMSAGGCASCRYYAMEQQARQKAAVRDTSPGAKPTA